MKLRRINKRLRVAHGTGWEATAEHVGGGVWAWRLTLRGEASDPGAAERAIVAAMRPFASVDDPEHRRDLIRHEHLAKRIEHWEDERRAGNPIAESELERLRAEARSLAERWEAKR